MQEAPKTMVSGGLSDDAIRDKTSDVTRDKTDDVMRDKIDAVTRAQVVKVGAGESDEEVSEEIEEDIVCDNSLSEQEISQKAGAEENIGKEGSSTSVAQPEDKPLVSRIKKVSLHKTLVNHRNLCSFLSNK